MTLNEANAVEAFLRDLLCGGVTHHTSAGPGFARRNNQVSGLGWHYLEHTSIPRFPHQVFVESFVREALIRLNPEIAAKPERTEEVLYHLNTIVRSVRSDGLIKANQSFTEWFRGKKSMPFGENNEHTTVRLIDFDEPTQNHYVVTPRYRFEQEGGACSPDLVLLINGFPVVVVEAKPPPRPSVSWFDRATTIRKEYEADVPELFVCNVLNLATGGRELRYGSIGMPVNLWGPWREVGAEVDPQSEAQLDASALGMVKPATLLDIMANFTLFATDAKKRLMKVVCRYQQYQGANLIVQRVANPEGPKQGLIWHFQGSGKSFLMVFAAQKLRLHPELDSPVVLIVVDRVDLDTQISKTFHGAKVENLVKAKTRAELKRLLKAGTKKIIITTIFRFGDESTKQEVNRLLGRADNHLKGQKIEAAETELGECADLLASLKPDDGGSLRTRLDTLRERFAVIAKRPLPPLPASRPITDDDEDDAATPGVALNDDHNVIVMVDEAHRTQEGGLGRKMRTALPNASLFGLTGTPINKRDRNTYKTFGAACDEGRYLHRYGFEDSIRDGATLPLHFVPRSSEVKIDSKELKKEYTTLTGGLSDVEKATVTKNTSSFGVLVKAPARVKKVVADMVRDFEAKVRPRGLAGMVVTYDQEACLIYKAELDKHLAPEVSDVVISVGNNRKDSPEYKKYERSRDAEELLLDRFRDPHDPLKILVVTAKLLTGFDAPILQTMYLDRPLRDHTLLQAICRTNRVYNENKQAGIIVDYLGLFDDAAKALKFDQGEIANVVESIHKITAQLPDAMKICLAFFEGVDRSLDEQSTHVAAINALGSVANCDLFGKHFRYLAKVWEVVSPDPVLAQYEDDYIWLTERYKAVRQTAGGGQQVWKELGPKTIELLYKHLSFNLAATDLENIVLDDELFALIQQTKDPDKTAREIAVKLKDYLKTKEGDLVVPEIAAKLDDLRTRYENGSIKALQYMKELLALAKRAVQANKKMREEEPVAEEPSEEQGKAALTALFESIKSPTTPVKVEKAVAGIDEVVRKVRFEGWSASHAGRRQINKEIRKVLFEHFGHADKELHERVFGYIEQYY
jgi:type I site-specific restriction-modification system R (restriction) subunit